MSSSIVQSRMQRWPFALAYLGFSLVSIPSWSQAPQSLPAGGQASKQPPTFTASGVQGTLAPSGYSAAGAAQDTSQAMRHAADLGQEDDLFPSQVGAALSCSQASRLLAAAQAQPTSFAANHALGVFYLYHRDFSHSLLYLRRAASIEPSDLATLRELALAYVGDKQYSQAIAILSAAAAAHRTDAALARSLAMAYEASGDPRSAIAAYQRAASMDASEQSQFASGVGLVRMGAADQAASLFSAASAAYPDSARLWMGLGVAQYLQQHKESALRSLMRATELDPSYLPSYSFLPLVYGVMPAADAEIKRRLGVLVVSHPESGDAHFDYALALLKERTQSADVVPAAEVATQLKLAIEKEPDLVDAHLQLGALYADANNYAEAIEEYRKTLQLEPENPQAHYRLSQMYRRNKQVALADDELGKFKALDAALPHGGGGMSDDAIELPSMSRPAMAGKTTCP